MSKHCGWLLYGVVDTGGWQWQRCGHQLQGIRGLERKTYIRHYHLHLPCHDHTQHMNDTNSFSPAKIPASHSLNNCLLCWSKGTFNLLKRLKIPRFIGIYQINTLNSNLNSSAGEITISKSDVTTIELHNPRITNTSNCESKSQIDTESMFIDSITKQGYLVQKIHPSYRKCCYDFDLLTIFKVDT